MKVEVLLSAMHLTDFSIVRRMNISSDILIINQTDHEGYQEETIDGYKVRMYSTTQRGLSRSRNMALIHASGDICLLADDDEVLADDYDKLICSAFERLPKASIIAFNVDQISKRSVKLRKPIMKDSLVNRFKTYSSWALAFKREDILRAGVYFNIMIGSGSGVISAGEETAWQHQARNVGLMQYEAPEIIATLLDGKSQWFKGYNEKYFYDLGANLTVNHPFLKHFLKYYFLWRLNKDTTLPKMKQLKYINAGIKGFAKKLGYNDVYGQ